MDITNYQNQLFDVINRSYLLDGVSGKPIEDGVTIKNYTDLIQNRSYANYSYERTNQLDGLTHIGTFSKGNSQRSKLPEPIIKCTPRKNETASRFNYAIDKYIDKRYLVSISLIICFVLSLIEVLSYTVKTEISLEMMPY